MTEINGFPQNEAFAAAGQATERATQQVREFSEHAAATGRGLGNLALDTYEQAIASYLDFEYKAADAAPADWLKTAIGTHAKFVKDVTDAYVKAARVTLD